MSKQVKNKLVGKFQNEMDAEKFMMENFLENGFYRYEDGEYCVYEDVQMTLDEFFDSEQKWTKGTFALTEEGDAVTPASVKDVAEHGRRFCVLGAAMVVYGVHPIEGWGGFGRLRQAAVRLGIGRGIVGEFRDKADDVCISEVNDHVDFPTFKKWLKAAGV